MSKTLVCIPTCKLDFFPEEMFLHKDTIFYMSRYPVSAPTNRNMCLIHAEQYNPEYIIMLDDDIKGFYPGWVEDLLEPFDKFPNCQLVSASLITSEGFPATMMDIKRDMSMDFQIVKEKCLPSACIAFRGNLNLLFDQRYTINNKGAGFEDTDFCLQIQQKFPSAEFVISNKCKLIHENECKGQEQIKLFHQYFNRKWGI